MKENFKQIDMFIQQGIASRASGDCARAVKYFKKILSVYEGKNKYFLNMIANEIEISEKKIVLKTKPRSLYLALTNRCNVNCRMCCVKQYPEWNMSDNILEEVMSMFCYLEKVTWLGGEVFLLEKFKNIFMEAAKYNDLRQIIVTNGLLLDENWARLLADAKVNLIFSIDGLHKESYEYIRRGSVYSKLMHNIEQINKSKKPNSQLITGMSFVVMRSNYRELDKIVDFAYNQGFKYLTINGALGCSEEVLDPARDEIAIQYIKTIMPRIRQHAKEKDIELNDEMQLGFNIEDDVAAKGLNLSPAFKFSCLYPWRSLVVDIYGSVKPWYFCQNELGNIQNESILSIWNNLNIRKYRESIIKMQYDQCPTDCVAKFGTNIEDKFI